MLTQKVGLVLDAVPPTLDLVRLGVGRLVQQCPPLGNDLLQGILPLIQVLMEPLRLLEKTTTLR